MGLQELLKPFVWQRYSKKMQKRILSLQFAGEISEEKEGTRHVVSHFGTSVEGAMITFHWQVSLEDGALEKVRYKVWGSSALIGALEGACSLIEGKNYDQAKRVSAELIDRELRDAKKVEAFPDETSSILNLVLEAIDQAAEKCTDIPLPSEYVAPPMPFEISTDGKGYPGFEDLEKEAKMGVIQQVIDDEIQPYIALDGGGIELIDLVQTEVHIRYQGNCTSCYSSIGATLASIQQLIQKNIHPSLSVIPDLNSIPK